MDMPEHPWEPKPGEVSVSTVEPNDLKIVWQFVRHVEAHAEPMGGLSAVAMDPSGLQEICSPGANVRALAYRAMMLRFLFMSVHATPDEPESKELSGFWHAGELNDRAFQVMSTIPLEWIPKGGRRGFPFDGEEFIRQLRAA
jgi:hypothetical protein